MNWKDAVREERAAATRGRPCRACAARAERTGGPRRPTSVTAGAVDIGAGREAKLREQEEKRIRLLGEAGYSSPYYIGDDLAHGGDPREAYHYEVWRIARTNWVVTRQQFWYDEMLSHVTFETPQLASDLKKPEDSVPVMARSLRLVKACLFAVTLIIMIILILHVTVA